MPLTEQTSINLQQKDTSIQEAQIYSELAISYLRRLRSDSLFEQFYSLTVQEAEDHSEEPCSPRYRRLPKRIDEGSVPPQF